MPLIERYSVTTQGGLILAGNTLNCRSSQPYPPAPLDFRNGSYISNNSSLMAYPGFPNGTTFNPTESSSTAVVSIPNNSEILYAQLFWFIYLANGAVPNQNDAINFTTPVTSTTISPNLALKQTDPFICWQAQDVTQLIQNGGTGTYTVGNVPGVTSSDGGTAIGNGWGLLIAYRNAAFPTRYLNINTGLVTANAGTPSDFVFNNIATPSSGPLTGYLFITDVNADLQDKAQILVGETELTAVYIGNTSNPWNLMPPYAPTLNMLPGNILVSDPNNVNLGLLDTRGTFGTYNRDPFALAAPPFARNVVDVAGFDISNVLANGFTTLFTRVTFAGIGGSQITSQAFQIDVNSANLASITKTVDNNFSDVGKVLTYTIAFTNEGLADANDVVIIDTIPQGTTFVAGSVTVDGSSQPGSNPAPPGIFIGTIPSNIVTTVSFKVTIQATIPSPNLLINNSQVTYNYLPAPGVPIVFTENKSNDVSTQVNSVILSSTKEVSQNVAQLGDTLTYTIAITNTGNITANNVLFIDTIPNGTSVVPGSFTQDGTPVIGSSNPPGVTLPNPIPVSSTSTVVFRVTITTIPTTNTVIDSATAISSFTIDPSTPIIGIASSNTNIVTTTMSIPILVINKIVNRSYRNYNNILIYTIAIQNSSNDPAVNIKFSDTLPSGTVLVPNSVTLNGVTQPEANPEAGITIGIIPAGTVSTITFSVQVVC